MLISHRQFTDHFSSPHAILSRQFLRHFQHRHGRHSRCDRRSASKRLSISRRIRRPWTRIVRAEIEDFLRSNVEQSVSSLSTRLFDRIGRSSPSERLDLRSSSQFIDRYQSSVVHSSSFLREHPTSSFQRGGNLRWNGVESIETNSSATIHPVFLHFAYERPNSHCLALQIRRRLFRSRCDSAEAFR